MPHFDRTRRRRIMRPLHVLAGMSLVAGALMVGCSKQAERGAAPAPLMASLEGAAEKTLLNGEWEDATETFEAHEPPNAFAEFKVAKLENLIQSIAGQPAADEIPPTAEMTFASPRTRPAAAVAAPPRMVAPTMPIRAQGADMPPLAPPPDQPEVAAMMAEEPSAAGGAPIDIVASAGAADSTGPAAPSTSAAPSAAAKPAPVDDPGYDTIQLFYATDRQSVASLFQTSHFVLPLGLCLGALGFYLLATRIRSRLALGGGHLLLTLALVAFAHLGVQWYRAGQLVGRPMVLYGNDRGELELGRAEVTIPRVHKTGEVESPSLLRLEIGYDKLKHVTLATVQRRAPDAFYQELSEAVAAAERPEVFIFIHGYNVSFENAARRTGQIAKDLKYQGVPLCYSWPSQGGVFEYTVDETNVAWTVPHLKQFLLDVTKHSGAKSVSLVAHSMGNRALTSALRELHLELRDESKLFDEVVLAAPDVDADLFRRDLAPSVVASCKRATLYASSNDNALVASKRVHGYPRAGDAGDQLVIVTGIDTIDVSKIDTSLLGHSYYGNSDSILADLKALLIRAAPPQERLWLAPHQRRDGLTYFVFERAGAGTLASPGPSSLR